MAGHSKWANIQHRKGRQDENVNAWTRVVRSWSPPVSGGGDPVANLTPAAGYRKPKPPTCPRTPVKRNIDNIGWQLEGVAYEKNTP